MKPPAQTTLEFLQQDSRFSTISAYFSLVPSLASLLSHKHIETTLFAPTDTAFARSRIIDTADSESLEGILRYHITFDSITSELLFDQLLLISLLPSEYNACDYQRLRVTLTSTSIQIQRSNIINANIQTSNGIIHAMDYPICPPPRIPRLLLQSADN